MDRLFLRDLRAALVGTTLLSSLILGWQHLVWGLVLVPLGFLAYIMLEDRTLRAQIGRRAWASEGFARFVVGTNLSLTVRISGLCGLLYLTADTLDRLIAG